MLLSLDQGTTSSRAILFSPGGGRCASAQREHQQFFPRPGWVEHDAEEIFRNQLAVARQSLRRGKVDAAAIDAIGITNQRETVVLWERASGRPLGHAQVWQSRVTAELCAELRAAGLEPEFRRRTGLLLDPYFSGTKLRWMLDKKRGLRRRAARGEILAGTIDTWLLWKLTEGAVHATDPSNASRTLLYNIHKQRWDPKLLELLDIPPEILPEVLPSAGVFGETSRRMFGRPLPVAGIAGDQQAATFGQGCLRPGMVKNTYGTGCFLLMNTGSEAVRSKQGLLTTIGWQIGDKTTYCLEGAVFVAGAAVQWLRDGLGLIKKSSEVEALARSVPDHGGVHLVPAFVGLGAPHWDPEARGLICGLTRGSSKAHLARAALESMAFQTEDVLAAMQEDAGRKLRRLRVDGGAAANDLLMQFQADLSGVTVERPREQESTAWGAALLAGVGIGLWRKLSELGGQQEIEQSFRPQRKPAWRRQRQADWSAAVARARS